MKKILLAVLEDEMYSNRFSDYISHHKNMYIDFMVFTGTGSIKDFVKNSKIDILLVNDTMACEVADIKNIKKIIVLSDGTYAGQQNYPVIFKYQSAEHILKEIFAQAADDGQIAGISQIYYSKQAELIAVFSPFGGAGASSYARNLCAGMAGNNNVLYINLEIFDSFAEFEKDAENKREYICGMSEVVYYIKQRKDKLAFKLESITNHHKNGYNYILPVEDYRDLYSITPDDMEYFTDVLGRETMYDKIVFDMGYINEASLKLLSLCDVLIVPEPYDTIQVNKQHSFERVLIHSGMEKTVNNIKYVSMKERWIPD